MALLGQAAASFKVKRIPPHGMRLHIPPILLCGASFSLKFRVFRNMHLGGRHIVIQGLGLGRRTTAGPAGKDFHNPHIGLLVKRQNVACAYRAGGLGRDITVDPHLARRHDRGSNGARFEKPRLPQPFIQPDRVAFFGQSFLNPAKAAANGLSGSIFFSTFGLAVNF